MVRWRDRALERLVWPSLERLDMLFTKSDTLTWRRRTKQHVHILYYILEMINCALEKAVRVCHSPGLLVCSMPAVGALLAGPPDIALLQEKLPRPLFPTATFPLRQNRAILSNPLHSIQNGFPSRDSSSTKLHPAIEHACCAETQLRVRCKCCSRWRVGSTKGCCDHHLPADQGRQDD